MGDIPVGGDEMYALRSKSVGILFILLLSMIFNVVVIKPVSSDYVLNPDTVGLWHLDEVNPEGYREITPDAVGKNHATLGGSPIPQLVEGKFDNGLQFDGRNFVYVPISLLVCFPPSPHPSTIPVSPALNIPEEIQIEAWIKVQGFKNVTYNNIVVKCKNTDGQWQNTSRICGLAVKAGLPQYGKSVVRGALSGFVSTYEEGFNEIVTTDYVVPLNQWVHVALTRSLNTGMHLYVNGDKKDVKAIRGVQNPQGSIRNGTEYYFGHDSKVIIDEVRISDLSSPPPTGSSAIEIGPNLLVAVILVTVILAIAWILRRLIRTWGFRSKHPEI
ncbi:MAG: LamG-like jellyroll fold domain-containing protein [Thermoproteota archaeon]